MDSSFTLKNMSFTIIPSILSPFGYAFPKQIGFLSKNFGSLDMIPPSLVPSEISCTAEWGIIASGIYSQHFNLQAFFYYVGTFIYPDVGIGIPPIYVPLPIQKEYDNVWVSGEVEVPAYSILQPYSFNIPYIINHPGGIWVSTPIEFPPVSSVPEPCTLHIVGLGLVAIAAYKRRIFRNK